MFTSDESWVWIGIERPEDGRHLFSQELADLVGGPVSPPMASLYRLAEHIAVNHRGYRCSTATAVNDDGGRSAH